VFSRYPVFYRYARITLTAIPALALSAAIATAQDAPKKAISGEVLFELQNDWATHSGDPTAERNDTFTTIEAAIEATLGNGLTAKAGLTFEPVTNAEPGKDRFFGDQGLYADALYLEYVRNAFTVWAGKFGQKLGIAWDVTPGVWGTDFAEDYELAEQIGLAVDYGFGSGDAGKHTVTIGTFFTDTTVLSESVITNRHRTKKTSGGAGNTEDFSSFSVALEGGEFKSLPGLGYHLAYVSRGADAAGESDEQSYAAALTYSFKAGAVEIAPLVEYAHQSDQAGVTGTDANYLTTAVAFIWGKWNLALSRTGRKTEATGSADVDDHVQQVSVGYAFDNGIGLNTGYRQSEESNVYTDIFGFVVDYTVKF
jgi:hypothetical protein